MITDAHVFEPDYRPQQLLHRDAEQQHLARALEPALDGDRATDVLLSGPHGVGKTALVHHLLHRLDQQAGIAYATVQCLGKTTAGIVRATLQDLGADPAGNTPEYDLCLQLQEWITEPTIGPAYERVPPRIHRKLGALDLGTRPDLGGLRGQPRHFVVVAT